MFCLCYLEYTKDGYCGPVVSWWVDRLAESAGDQIIILPSVWLKLPKEPKNLGALIWKFLQAW